MIDLHWYYYDNFNYYFGDVWYWEDIICVLTLICSDKCFPVIEVLRGFNRILDGV